MILLADTRTGTLTLGTETVSASVGRSGPIPPDQKREADGHTPLGLYTLKTALLRPDRMPAPVTALPWRWLRPSDGWSDDPSDPAYNHPVSHPHACSAEHLWRTDHAYDIIITLSHNTPPIPNRGSAIFLHCLQPDSRPTEGCIAISLETLARWLPHFTPSTQIQIN